MKGKYRIIVQNNKIKYDFEIKRNITVIRGDSATGKTALVDMIQDFYENGIDSGIELQCSRTCAVLSGRNWKMQLTVLRNSIIFIDEGNPFVTSTDFAEEIQKTDNYYVIVTRESLDSLPYSVNEIYGIRDSGKYGYLKKTYNELFQIYGETLFGNKVSPDLIITEDSNSGFQFFKAISERRGIRCISANGKSNIFQRLLEHHSGKVLVIADGAAIGSEMGKLMKLIESQGDILLYLPESFEWMVLKSGVINDRELTQILRIPYDFIESLEFFSWERFFTSVLVSHTNDTYLRYSKNRLNSSYTQENVVNKIVAVMEMIDLS